MNSILCIGGTHGDESIGVEVLSALARERSDFDWMIGNIPALEQGVRYVDTDLNRSAPGDPLSDNWEERRAATILDCAANYRYTIDIHGSIKKLGICIIITNPTKENLILASLFKIPRIVIWDTPDTYTAGPLSSTFPCGLEIECGVKTDPRIQNQLRNILIDFLNNYKERERMGWESRLHMRRIFRVTGVIRPGDIEASALQEFTEIRINDASVTPLFIGSYPYENILAYSLSRIPLEQALSLTI